jgi:Protease inhibitor Inh
MAGLVPAIHAFSSIKTWMPGTSLQPGRPKAGPGCPAMTASGVAPENANMQPMKWLLSLALAAVAFAADAQTQEPLNDSAKRMLGTWEFTNAARDKTCTVTFENARAKGGMALRFDPECLALFPLLRDVTAWKFPPDDLLYMINAQGRALIEFSEAEDGVYEAPTPGLGVLFLQAPGAAAGPPPLKPEQIAGTWALKRGEGKPLCTFALGTAPAQDGFALTVQPGCDGTIAKAGLVRWRIDNGQLVLVPAQGAPWRFEEIDDVTWRLLPDRPDQLSLVKQ